MKAGKSDGKKTINMLNKGLKSDTNDGWYGTCRPGCTHIDWIAYLFLNKDEIWVGFLFPRDQYFYRCV